MGETIQVTQKIGRMKNQILFDRINHFHVLVRIKEEKQIGFYKKLNSDSPPAGGSVGFQTTTDLSEFGEPERVDISKLKRPIPSKHFSHLFNAYSRYFNNRNETHGTLFERRFKRKHIDNMEYLQRWRKK